MRSRKVFSFYFALCFFIFISCSRDSIKTRNLNAAPTNSSPEQEISTQEITEKIVLREISERISGTSIKNLKEQKLQLHSSEIRFWIGDSLTPLQGIILEQKGDEWAGMYLAPVERKSTKIPPPRALLPPKDGWRALWKKLENLGIFALPDAEDVGANSYYSDAPIVLIEISTNESYKNYMYVGFTTTENLVAKKVKTIVDTILDQFSLKPLGK